MQGVEVGDAVNAENDGLVIDDEALCAVAESRLDDPRIPFGPVIAVSGDQTHAIALALTDQAIAVVLDLMDPVWARMEPWWRGWVCRSKLTHGAEIGQESAGSIHSLSQYRL